MIEEAGEVYYNKVLQLLAKLAESYQTTVANVATAYVLQTSGVSSVILGPRNTKHISELDNLSSLVLANADYQQLRDVHETLRAHNTDDIYSYERDMSSPHGEIMKYNLNGMRSSEPAAY
jgi:predicted aldo/keto reductase-like oxidoreductase